VYKLFPFSSLLRSVVRSVPLGPLTASHHLIPLRTSKANCIRMVLLYELPTRVNSRQARGVSSILKWLIKGLATRRIVPLNFIIVSLSIARYHSQMLKCLLYIHLSSSLHQCLLVQCPETDCMQCPQASKTPSHPAPHTKILARSNNTQIMHPPISSLFTS